MSHIAEKFTWWYDWTVLLLNVHNPDHISQKRYFIYLLWRRKVWRCFQKLNKETIEGHIPLKCINPMCSVEEPHLQEWVRYPCKKISCYTSSKNILLVLCWRRTSCLVVCYERRFEVWTILKQDFNQSSSTLSPCFTSILY